MDTKYSKAISVRSNDLWSELEKKTIGEAADSYLGTLSYHTKRAYRSSFNSIFHVLQSKNMLSPQMSLQVLVLANLENLLDCIKNNIIGSQATKQARCATFIAFTRYLERATGGMIRIAKCQRGHLNATFKKIREKATTKAMTREQWDRFIAELKSVSPRDYLIAKAALQGAKRISEILDATVEQIDWEKNRISYKQAKNLIHLKKTIISYPIEFMNELKNYLFGRINGFIFQTRTGKKVTQPHLHRIFSYASMRAGLSFNVHPHMLRTTAITWFMGLGYHSDQIMRISGHSTSSAVLYYDKTAIEENLTVNTKII